MEIKNKEKENIKYKNKCVRNERRILEMKNNVLEIKNNKERY